VTLETVLQNGARGEAGARMLGFSVASITKLNDVTALARRLGHPLNVVNIFVGWQSPFPAQAVDAIAATGAVPEITWEPWDYQLGVHQDTFPLASIASGAFDGYTRSWALAAAAWKRPLLLRFAHEMNGNWYPWGIGVNGNTARDYVDAYRHLHATFESAGATDVSWIWSPNVIWRGSGSLAAMYPGARYVDLIGIDGYNAGTSASYSRWSSPAQVFGRTLADIETFASDRAILITETGSSSHGGSKAAWIGELLGYLATQPRVVGFVWSEFDGRADWPIDTSATSVAAMRSALARDWGSATR